MQVCTNKTKSQDVNGMVVCMQVLYYDNTRLDNTGFGTSNWLCMLLKRYAIVTIVPNLGRPGLC